MRRCESGDCKDRAVFVVQVDLDRPYYASHRCYEHGKDEPHKIACICESYSPLQYSFG